MDRIFISIIHQPTHKRDCLNQDLYSRRVSSLIIMPITIQVIEEV